MLILEKKLFPKFKLNYVSKKFKLWKGVQIQIKCVKVCLFLKKKVKKFTPQKKYRKILIFGIR